ncbi:hypothetical protein [Chloroflexus islandicus]|uniref:hypothetical protein n=1 Tax=Chloroflexus islandicus TaxID=1707952 RepID=UPI000AAA58B9|nr:hypothetical protein [Chloroflexus islandicus]
MKSRWGRLFAMAMMATLLATLMPAAPAQVQDRICFNEVPDCIEGRFAEFW